MASYSEKLKDPRWQKCRLEVLQKSNFSCVLCSDETTELHIHHKSYISGREPWEYDQDNFMPLCKHCHAAVEDFGIKNGTPVTGTKVFNEDLKCFVVTTVFTNTSIGIVISIFRYYLDGQKEGVVVIKRQTFLKMENLFSYAENMI